MKKSIFAAGVLAVVSGCTTTEYVNGRCGIVGELEITSTPIGSSPGGDWVSTYTANGVDYNTRAEAEAALRANESLHCTGGPNPSTQPWGFESTGFGPEVPVGLGAAVTAVLLGLGSDSSGTAGTSGTAP